MSEKPLEDNPIAIKIAIWLLIEKREPALNKQRNVWKVMQNEDMGVQIHQDILLMLLEVFKKWLGETALAAHESLS